MPPAKRPVQPRSERARTATIYTVADTRYFLGAVALVNSLRLTGNHGDIVVLDAGLDPQQRALLSGHVTLLDVPLERRDRPIALVKPSVLARHATRGPVVIVDSDMIVTRSLADVVELAEDGKICVFAHPDDTAERWFPEWTDAFALRAPLRRRAYVNAGFIAVSTARWPDLLERWGEASDLVPTDRYFRDWDDPLYAGDQEALNAILMSEVPPDAVMELPVEQEVYTPAFPEVEVVDAATLSCRHRGHPTVVLHHSWTPKPWMQSYWSRIRRRDAFLQLFARVLLSSDAEIPLSPARLPIWMRPGLVGQLARRVALVVSALRRSTEASVRVLPPPLRRGIKRVRRRLAPREREQKLA